MIDLTSETTIPLTDVAIHIPARRGRKVHYSTIYRWVTKGAKGRKLESILVGGVRFTSIEAVHRFLNVHCRQPHNESNADDQNAAIEQALKDAGI